MKKEGKMIAAGVVAALALAGGTSYLAFSASDKVRETDDTTAVQTEEEKELLQLSAELSEMTVKYCSDADYSAEMEVTASGLRICKDGEEEIQEEVQYVDGKHFVSAETLAAYTGSDYSYDTATETAEIISDDYGTISFTFGEKTIDVRSDAEDTQSLKDQISMDTTPILQGEDLLIPLEDAGPLLGCEVQSEDDNLYIDRQFQSCRIIVASSQPVEDAEALDCASGFRDYYVFQYDSEKKAKAAMDRFNEMDCVRYAEPDRVTIAAAETYGLQAPYTDSTQTATGLADAEANLLETYGSFGAMPEVNVAVLDTDFSFNSAVFENRIRTDGFDVAENDYDYSGIKGHGTNVVGTLVLNSLENTKILPVKIANNSGTMTTMSETLGIYYAIQHDSDIINMSFGAYAYTSTEHEALQEAYSKGIALFAAYGNDDVQTENYYPACFDEVMGVSGLWSAEGYYDKAYFSNYGGKVDFSAPGNWINSISDEGEVVQKSGTSVSCPVVSGSAAIILTQNPDYSPAELKTDLIRRSKDLGEEGWDEIFGYGLVCVADKSAHPVKNGESKYETLKDAVEDAKDGDTICIYDDIALNETITVEKNITIITENTYTITRGSGFTDVMFNVTDTGSLTLGDDSDYTHCITVSGSDQKDASSMISVGENGTLVLNMHSALQNNSAASDGGAVSNEGTLILNGGTVSGNSTQGLGAGIYNKGQIVLRGTSDIEDEVYLAEQTYIEVEDELSAGMKPILINFETWEENHLTAEFADGLNVGTIFFSSMNEEYSFICDGQSVVTERSGDTEAIIGDAEYTSVFDAIEHAEDGDTVLLCKNIALNKTLEITENINIAARENIQIFRADDMDQPLILIKKGAVCTVGDSNQGIITLSGSDMESSSSLVETEADSESEFRNVTFALSNGISSGSAFQNNGITDLENCIFEYNSCSGSGAALYNIGTVNINSCVFRNNTADDNGGAIYNEGTLNITDSTISSNSTVNAGGGVYNSDDGTATMTNTLVESNKCIYNTATLWSWASGSSGTGGGIFNKGTCILNNCSVSENYSGYFGGGITNYGIGYSGSNGKIQYAAATMEIHGGSITDNIAKYTFGSGVISIDGSGGGLLNWGDCLIENCRITGNSARVSGDGITNGGKLKLSDVDLENSGGYFDFNGYDKYMNHYALYLNSHNDIYPSQTIIDGGIISDDHSDNCIYIDTSTFVSLQIDNMFQQAQDNPIYVSKPYFTSKLTEETEPRIIVNTDLSSMTQPILLEVSSSLSEGYHLVKYMDPYTPSGDDFSLTNGKRLVESGQYLIYSPTEHQHDLQYYEPVEPDCVNEGSTGYYKCKTCGKTFSDENAEEEISTDTCVLAALGHDKEFTRATVIGCSGQENHPYYYHCSRCGKNFSSYYDTEEMNLEEFLLAKTGGHDTSYHKAKKATCTEDGNNICYQCDYCHKYFSDDEGEHELAEDKVIIRGKHVMEYLAEQEPVGCQTGMKACYHCTECDGYFADKDGDESLKKEDLILPAEGHQMQKLEAKAAGCTEKGNIECYYCSLCDSYFLDEEGLSEIPGEAAELPAQGCTFDGPGTMDESGEITLTCSRCGAEEQAGKPIGSLVTSGTRDELHWTLDYQGVLNIWGTGSVSPEFMNDTFEEYVDSIKIIRVGMEEGDAITCIAEDAFDTFFVYNDTAEKLIIGPCVTEYNIQEVFYDDYADKVVRDTEEHQHVFTDYQSDNNADCFRYGTETAVCDTCGETTDTRTVLAVRTEHVFNAAEIVEPDCCHQGYTVMECSNCHYRYKTDYTAPLTHEYTYETKDEDQHTMSCSNCGASFTVNHTYKDGVCIWCGEASPDNQPARLITQPSNVTAGVKSKVSFKVQAQNAVSYQWQYSKNGTKWYNSTSASAKTSELTLTVSSSNKTNQYRCKITGEDGTAIYSKTVSINLIPGAKITTQPSSVCVLSGEKAVFTVSADNAASYQWYYSKDSGTNWYKSTAAGAGTDTFTITVSSSNRNNLYKCKITGTDGNTVSSSPVGIVLIAAQPENSTAAIGEDGTFSVTADADNPVAAYKWYYSKDSGASWYASTAAGADTETLSVKASSANRTNLYRCKVTGTAGLSGWTAAVGFTESAQSLVITEQPVNAAASVGERAVFTVTAENAAETGGYQWYYSKDGKTWYKSTAAGSTGNTLTVTVTAANRTNRYKCKITGTDGTVKYSDTVTIQQ